MQEYTKIDLRIDDTAWGYQDDTILEVNDLLMEGWELFSITTNGEWKLRYHFIRTRDIKK